jgi:hypothetical protein
MCCMDDDVWLQEKNMSNTTIDITLILASPYFLHTDLIAKILLSRVAIIMLTWRYATRLSFVSLIRKESHDLNPDLSTTMRWRDHQIDIHRKYYTEIVVSIATIGILKL